jgi:hypothetical protein
VIRRRRCADTGSQGSAEQRALRARDCGPPARPNGRSQTCVPRGTGSRLRGWSPSPRSPPLPAALELCAVGVADCLRANGAPTGGDAGPAEDLAEVPTAGVCGRSGLMARQGRGPAPGGTAPSNGRLLAHWQGLATHCSDRSCRLTLTPTRTLEWCPAGVDRCRPADKEITQP